MAEQLRRSGWPALLVAGLSIGAVEALAAIAFGAMVHAGYLGYFLEEGIGLYLAAAAICLALFAWRAGRRGVIGSLQAPAVAMLTILASTTAIDAYGSVQAGFLTMVAATMLVTILCGAVFWVVGKRRWGNVIRFVPYPVVGGFLAGAGWLLFRGGIHASFDETQYFTPIADLIEGRVLRLWLPAFAFGLILLLAVRFVKRPLVIPITIGIGLVVFLAVVVATGSGLEEVRRGGWLLGPFDTERLWQPWALRAPGGADWGAVLESWAGIAAAVFVAAIAILFNISGSEIVLDRDLDTNEELRDAGLVNVVSGAVGGIPGYHALSLTALAERMNVDARAAGLVLAVVLFAVNYGRVELVREVAFGETYRSNVDRPPAERARLRTLADRIQILRVSGFVFFGSTNGLLEKIRRRAQTAPPRFLVLDLQRVSGVDSSAVVSFAKAMREAETHGFEIVLTGASEPVRRQLERGGVVTTEHVLRFEPDLDRGLEHCEEGLLATTGTGPAEALADLGPMPAGLEPYLERVELEAGTVLLHQDDPPGDIYVLERGHLAVETRTSEGTRLRLRSVRPGVVVGEIALYTGIARTADVVAEVPSVVLRFSREAIARMEAEEPELAAALHRWLASTLAERLTDTMRAVDTLLR